MKKTILYTIGIFYVYMRASHPQTSSQFDALICLCIMAGIGYHLGTLTAKEKRIDKR